MRKTNTTDNEASLSHAYYKSLKEAYLQLIQNGVQSFLVDHGGGKVILPFHINAPSSEYYVFHMVDDLDDGVGFEGLDKLVTKFLSEFSEGEHICAAINGNTQKSVKFYIGRSAWSLKEFLEYGDIVGINHTIYMLDNTDKFRFTEDGKNIVFCAE